MENIIDWHSYLAHLWPSESPISFISLSNMALVPSFLGPHYIAEVQNTYNNNPPELCLAQPLSMHLLAKTNQSGVPVSANESWPKVESTSNSFSSIFPICFQIHRLYHHIHPLSSLYSHFP